MGVNVYPCCILSLNNKVSKDYLRAATPVQSDELAGMQVSSKVAGPISVAPTCRKLRATRLAFFVALILSSNFTETYYLNKVSEMIASLNIPLLRQGIRIFRVDEPT